nr:retrovirus-related Pol polyprotein from transposon TNT 1-94 [Tanacetum cinerariifolium]
MGHEMKHYVEHTDYPIWEVIQKGNEGLHKAYDRFQSLLSQLETHGVGFSTEDANQKFLRSLPSSWSQVSLITRTKTGVDTPNFDDLYKNLRVFESDVKVLLDHLLAHKCRSKGNQDGRRRDAGNTGYKARDNGKKSTKQDKHKAMVTIDGEGVDRTGHAEDDIEDYTLMVFNSSYSGSNTKMSDKDKSGLWYGSQIHDGVLSYENEVFASVSDSRSSDVEDSPVNDRFEKVKGMHEVPPPMTVNYMPLKSDFGIDKSKFTYGLKQSTTSKSDAKTSDIDSYESSSSEETLETVPKPIESKPKVVNEPKVWSDALIIEEYESDSDDEYVSKALVEQDKPSCAFINIVKHVKTPRQTAKEQNTCSQNPKPRKRDWNGLMSKKMGLGYGCTKKACFVCGSFSHLIRDCDFHEKRMAKQTLKGKGIVDSGCSRHMTENKAYLGHVAFGGSKGQITDTGCLVLYHDYKLPDEHQVLLRVPRQHNMYSFNLENIVPSGGLACLIAKATIDETTKWHMRDIIEFCGSKGIKREYSNAKTLKQNGVAERKNRTLIEAARTMLADSFLPNTFWAESVSTACYVLNRVLVTNPQHKTPYELLTGKIPIISYIRPFGCHVTILNTIDHLENKANKTASLKKTNNSAGTQDSFDPGNSKIEAENAQEYYIPSLKDIYEVSRDGIFTSASYDDEGAMADFTNLETIVNVSPIPTSRIHSIHPTTEILRDPTSAVQTRSKVNKRSGAYAFILVDLPFRKKAIRTKWVYKNKKDERDVVVRNKVRLVAYGHRQEEGIDYDEVFAHVARIEAIRIFLAFASYMGFIVYKMDVKSAFLYGKIDEEVYASQPSSFIDPKFLNKVYKVVKALYGLHQAPRVWYATISTFLVQSGYRRGLIDKTMVIKKDKKDIMLVQVYVDDIIFGSTKKSWCDEFEALMKNMFQMSYMGELTFFLGLQVNVKTASTPIDTKKPLVKDEEAADVDVHLYRSMIGSLMYLIASRPDIMYAVCACSRFQVTPKTSHLQAMKRIVRYLKGQQKLGLWYLKESAFDLEAYSDSDYAGANLDRKSTTGGC